MRLSELAGKEVINMVDGSRLGIIDECELVFDPATGKMKTLILPERSGIFTFFGDRKGSSIPWEAIKRIGDDVIIVDLDYESRRFNPAFYRHG